MNELHLVSAKKSLELTADNTPITLNLNQAMQYQLQDAQGNLIDPQQIRKTEWQADDLYLYLNDNSQPTLILENFASHSFPTDKRHYLISPQLSTRLEIPYFYWLFGGLALFAGVTSQINRGKSGNHNDNSPHLFAKAPPQPTANNPNKKDAEKVTPLENTDNATPTKTENGSVNNSSTESNEETSPPPAIKETTPTDETVAPQVSKEQLPSTGGCAEEPTSAENGTADNGSTENNEEQPQPPIVDESSPADEEAIPPANEEQLPPTAENTDTPTEAENGTAENNSSETNEAQPQPPAVDESSPADEEATPPANEEQLPPTEEREETATPAETENGTAENNSSETSEAQSQPPAVDESSPADEEVTPPANEEQLPPTAENTDTPAETENGSADNGSPETSEAQPPEVENNSPTDEATTPPVSEEQLPPTAENTDTPTETENGTADNGSTETNEAQPPVDEENKPADEEPAEQPKIPLAISLDSITGDDLINVSEATRTINISGRIEGSEATSQSVVNLTLNGQTITATVNENLTFNATVEGRDLVTNSGYQLQASVTANNETAQTQRSYQVAPNAVASIDIQSIEENVESPSVRLEGRINFAGIFAQGQNASLINYIQVNIGENSYKVGLRTEDQRFSLDLPRAEWQKLNGQAVTLSVPNTTGYQLVEEDGKANNFLIYRKEKSLVEIQSFELNGEAVVAEGQGYRIQLSEATSLVSGIVGGNAQAGDQVEIMLNNQRFSTTVSEAKTFSVAVPTALLNSLQNQPLTAVLSTKDYANNPITVQDQESFVNAPHSSSDFVATHSLIEVDKRVEDRTSPDYNIPYFIKGIETSRSGESYLSGFLSKIPVGGASQATLKYYFMTQQDMNTGAEDPKKGEQNVSKKEEDQAPRNEGHQDVREEIKAITRQAYDILGKYINVKFEEVTDRQQADSKIFDTPLQGPLTAAGSSGVDLYWNLNTQATEDNQDFMLLVALHEIGHTLNMKHTFENQGNGLINSFAGMSYPFEGNTEFTQMAYEVAKNSLARRDVPMFDLAYLHYRFGVNPNARTGNDVYSFKNYNSQSNDGDIYIWDGGGVDTFDASAEKQGVNVNLTPGSWIYRGNEIVKNFAVATKQQIGMKDFFGLSENDELPEQQANAKVSITTYTDGQAFIGFGTQIENLIGSEFADKLTGNKADNAIYGGAGNDLINGGEGNDYLDGGQGADMLIGGLGDDRYVVDDPNDEVRELAGEGEDTVYASLNYTLGENVENLVLTGSNSLTGNGNALANTLTANNAGNTLQGFGGNDRLIGGLGADTLTGGKDNDIFVFNTALNGKVDTITDFTSGEDKIELARPLFTELTVSNFEDYIKYDRATGELSYDPDGKGSADPIHFATLSNKVELTQSDFILA